MARLQLVSLLSLALLLGCAPRAGGPRVSPADIPALEQARLEHPSDPTTATRLGIAYYEAERYPLARDVLRAAVVLDQPPYAAHVYLGLSLEALGDLAGARAAYQAAGQTAIGDRQRTELDQRLRLLAQRELAAEAKATVAREAELSASPPEENTVAVFPLRYVGTNEELRPLERGLTHLIITDLSKVDRLRLLERERVQALVDELALAEGGRVEPGTGARTGRMLRAERVVQGSVQELGQGERLQLDANVVTATDASVAATGSASDQLRQLFDLEKRVVLQLLERLGIALSPAEARAISERPTADLQAFLAFSRGLEAQDRGDHATAEQEFSAAVRRDPNFRAARDRRSAMRDVAMAMQLPPRELAGLPQGDLRSLRDLNPTAPLPSRVASVLRSGVERTVPTIGSRLTGRFDTGLPTVRPSVPETFQQDDPRTIGLVGEVIIIITRP